MNSTSLHAAQFQAAQLQAAVGELQSRLQAESRPERSTQEKRYLKSPLQHFGVSVPVARRLTRAWVKEFSFPVSDLPVLVSLLWTSDWFEMRFAAVEVLVFRRDQLDVSWFDRLRDLIDSTFTWALVDPLSTDVTGSLLLTYDRSLWEPVLSDWSRDPNFWVRRASMLSQLRPLRSPSFDASLFFGFADSMLDEKEFFIRKAIGWVLRDMSRTRAVEVEAWMRPRIGRMSGVTYREAIKYISPAAQAEFASLRAG